MRYVDSHTEGEPTRVILSGGPDLGTGSTRTRLTRFRRLHDRFRRLVIDEPRGSGVAVGALLCRPSGTATAGVIFFDNAGYLGMCGHGTIGVVVTLAHIGRLLPGLHVIETPVGRVSTQLHSAHEVTFTNVASYRHRSDVNLQVPGHGRIRGDIAWGGNWFFIVNDPPVELRRENVDSLVEFTWRIRQELERKGIRGGGGAQVDHIELFGPPRRRDSDSQNFVLCPGKMYDRSPCGTGTSAKMACLFADGQLKSGELWRQEGILGTTFEGRIFARGSRLYPSIRGSAYVVGEGDLIFDPEDPLLGSAPE